MRRDPANACAKNNGGLHGRLLEDVPYFVMTALQSLITSARKGTIPAHIWRSAHVVLWMTFRRFLI